MYKNKKQGTGLLFIFLGLMISGILFSCDNPPELPQRKRQVPAFDWQGHRGCRGILPENTIPAFREALKFGVTTLEMDVAITKDSVVVLSHEPWMSHVICRDLNGQPITEEKEREFKLKEMTFEDIKYYDCGTLPHPNFPMQRRLPMHKPSLIQVIENAELYVRTGIAKHKADYNIEIKSRPEWDSVYTYSPEAFVDILISTLEGSRLKKERVYIQSFDIRPLKIMHEKYPDYKLVYLVEEDEPVAQCMEKLGFTPSVYSPYYKHLTAEKVKEAQKAGMRVVSWTVNERSEVKSLVEMGVDGIITDYPDNITEWDRAFIRKK